MPELFANDAYTTLDGDIDDDDTTLVVADGALFPTEGDFRIRIDDEFMLVTGVSGTTWTVTRAVEGMGVTESGTPADHLDGAEIRQILTRDGIANLGGGGGGSGTLTPELLLPEDDDFPETSMDSKWSRVKSPTTKGDWLVGNGVLSWRQHTNAGSELDAWLQASTIAVGDYIQAAFRFLPGAQWYSAWIGFSDTNTWNTGTQVGSWVHWSGGTYRLLLNTYVAFQNRTQDGTFTDYGVAGTIFHIRVKYVAANTWGVSFSPDGRFWYDLQTNYSRTMTPSYLMIGTGLLNPTNNWLNILDFYYFRKNAVTP